MESNCEIRVYDSEFNWLAAETRATSVQLKRELYGAGSFEIHVHPDSPGAGELIKRNNIIVLNRSPSKSGVIRDFYLQESRSGTEIVVTGTTGNGLAKQRITVPPTKEQDIGALGWDKVSANAETVIKHYVSRNMVNPYDYKRKIANMVILEDRKRGIAVPWKSRYADLSEELYNIASYSEMGYETRADIAGRRWEFDVIEGVDRTDSQNILSPVRFRMDYQNVGDYKYSEDYKNYKSTGYAGGQGEDENRLVYTLGADFEGIDRWEAFLDCGNAADIDELIYYGGQRLSEYKEAKTIDAGALALSKAFVFEKDFFLGDRVSVYISRLGISIDTRITEVKEIWERQTGYSIEVRFGNKVPNLFVMLKKRGEAY